MNTAIDIMAEELVKEALDGKEAAFRELFERNFPRVYRIAAAYTGGCYDDAADICQTAFIRAFRRLDSLREPSKFDRWLCAIARHTAINYVNKRNSMAETPLQTERCLDMLVTNLAGENHGINPAEIKVIHEVIESIKDESTKMTVKLFYIDGNMTTGEIARKQGIPKSTVTTRLSRFRAKYQKRIMLKILRLRGEQT